MPDDDDSDDDRWQLSTNIDCKPWKDPTADVDNTDEYRTATTAWVILVIVTFFFFIRDIFEFLTDYKNFFTCWKNIRNLMVDTLLICVLFKGNPDQEQEYERWQYHIAIFTSFSLWFQMMMVSGEYPGYGKYVHMFT